MPEAKLLREPSALDLLEELCHKLDGALKVVDQIAAKGDEMAPYRERLQSCAIQARDQWLHSQGLIGSNGLTLQQELGGLKGRGHDA